MVRLILEYLRGELENFIFELIPLVCSLCNKRISRRNFPANICNTCSSEIPLRNSNVCFDLLEFDDRLNWEYDPKRLSNQQGTFIYENKEIKLHEKIYASNFCQESKPNLLNYKNCLPLFVVTFYDLAVRVLVTGLKFHRRKDFSVIMGDIISVFWHREKRLRDGEFVEMYMDIDYTIAIPLHEKRLRERGYNQVELFAKRFAENENIRYLPGVLFRQRETKRQSETESKIERLSNVEGAFSINKNICLKGKKVLLVDDVIASGNTLLQAAKVLLQSEAEPVLLAFSSNRNI